MEGNFTEEKSRVSILECPTSLWIAEVCLKLNSRGENLQMMMNWLRSINDYLIVDWIYLNIYRRPAALRQYCGTWWAKCLFRNWFALGEFRVCAWSEMHFTVLRVKVVSKGYFLTPVVCSWTGCSGFWCILNAENFLCLFLNLFFSSTFFPDNIS